MYQLATTSPSLSRAAIALRGREELGISAAAVARQVGVSTSAITKAIERAAGKHGGRKG